MSRVLRTNLTDRVHPVGTLLYGSTLQQGFNVCDLLCESNLLRDRFNLASVRKKSLGQSHYAYKV